MSHLRFDMATNEWVIFAPSRSLRPHDLSRQTAGCPEPAPKKECPFCPGNEAFTPGEIYAVRDAGGSPPSNWRVRVFPNKFPALQVEQNPARYHDAEGFPCMGGCGAHEVIVESPQHDLALAQQPAAQIELVLSTVQRRCRDLLNDLRIRSVVAFKNHGLGAGTSLVHPHWQLIATPVVPRALRVQHQEAENYFDRHGACLFCVMRENELRAQARIVAANDRFVAFMPFASHVPFETWIMPRHSQPAFTRASPDDLRLLSELLKTVLLKLYNGLDNPDFNLTIDDVPRGDEDQDYFQWHLRILPRLTTPAGFELGSGMSINAVLPEEAAAFLREVRVG
jgi:UDPglucose--hexose-1-phosphate uridylyltransferase